MRVNAVDAEIIIFYLPEDLKLENEAKLLSIFYTNDIKKEAEELKFSVEFLRGLLRRIPIESTSMAKIFRDLRSRLAYDLLLTEYGSKDAPRSKEEQIMLDKMFQDMTEGLKEAKNVQSIPVDGGGPEDENSGEESGKD